MVPLSFFPYIWFLSSLRKYPERSFLEKGNYSFMTASLSEEPIAGGVMIFFSSLPGLMDSLKEILPSRNTR